MVNMLLIMEIVPHECCLCMRYVVYIPWKVDSSKICYMCFYHKGASWLCCTLRSGLHEIPTMIMTFPHGLDNNHAGKWISDNFPGMLTYVIFLEKCQKSICMHGCSPIHVERSFFFLKVWDRFVP